MRVPATLLAAMVALAACEQSTHPVAPADVAFSQAPSPTGAVLEHAWGGDQMWELMKPRPPGIGASSEEAVHLYIVAPLVQGAPLSPEIPGMVGGRDHVVPLQAGNRGEFKGIARTVPLLPADPFDPRVGWAFIFVAGAPGDQVPVAYAVQLDGEECPRPLSSAERIQAAIAEGLVVPVFPQEPAWPFAIRPTSERGQGRVTVEAPSGCVAPGMRAGG